MNWWNKAKEFLSETRSEMRKVSFPMSGQRRAAADEDQVGNDRDIDAGSQ